MQSFDFSSVHVLQFILVLVLTTVTIFESKSVLVAASSPADQINQACNAVIYCLPSEGELWLPQQNNFVRWNYNYPTFASTGFVNISLYNIQSQTPVNKWPLYENAEGLMVINTLPVTWFIGSDLVQQFYFIITGSNDPPSITLRGPTFSIQRSLTSSTAVASATASPTNTSLSNTPIISTSNSPNPTGFPSLSPPDTREEESSGLSVGAICGIAVGSVLLITAVACIIYIVRRKQNAHKQGYDSQLESESGSGVHGYSANSATILGTTRDNASNSDTDSTLPMTESLNAGKRSSLCLTVKGAQELAHAYRKMLTNKDTVEEITQHNQQRSLYSDELLRRELAADGHGVKNVSTAPAIVVVGDDQVSLHSMSADPSEPDSKPKP